MESTFRLTCNPREASILCAHTSTNKRMICARLLKSDKNCAVKHFQKYLSAFCFLRSLNTQFYFRYLPSALIMSETVATMLCINVKAFTSFSYK